MRKWMGIGVFVAFFVLAGCSGLEGLEDLELVSAQDVSADKRQTQADREKAQESEYQEIQ